MGVNKKYKVAGVGEVIQQMKDLPINIAKNALRNSVNKGSKALVESLQAAAPVGTGQLRDSIKFSRSKLTKDGVAKGGVRGMFYGRMLELGTSKMAARPWARPVIDRLSETVLKTINDTLKPAFEKAAKRAAKKAARGK